MLIASVINTDDCGTSREEWWWFQQQAPLSACNHLGSLVLFLLARLRAAVDIAAIPPVPTLCATALNIIAPTLTRRQKSSYSSSLFASLSCVCVCDAERVCSPSGDKMQMARQNMHIPAADSI